MKPEKMMMILPDICSTIFIEVAGMFVQYPWFTSDELSNPRKLKDLKRLTEVLMKF